MDYRVYMGSSMTVRSLWWLLLYLCSYKLDGSVIVPTVNQSRGGAGAHQCRPEEARRPWWSGGEALGAHEHRWVSKDGHEAGHGVLAMSTGAHGGGGSGGGDHDDECG